MKILTPLVLAALGAMLAQPALAQNATTTPVGAMTYTFNATATVTTTTMSIPLMAPPVYSGKVSSLTPNSITVTGAAWVAGAYAAAAQPYFVVIKSGSQAGRMLKVTANTSDTLTLDTSDNSTQATALDFSGWALAAGASGDSFELIPGDTLATIFGDNSGQNPLLFVGGSSTLNADSISIFNKSTGLWDAFYFHQTAGNWRKKGDNVTNQNNTVVYPEAGFMITRRSGRPAAGPLTITGTVPTVAPITKFSGTSQATATSSRFPVDCTIANLRYSHWTKGTSTLNSDVLNVFNPTTGMWDAYYQLSSNSQWRKRGDNVTDYSNFSIQAGSAITITKRGALTNTQSLVSSTQMPYALQ